MTRYDLTFGRWIPDGSPDADDLPDDEYEPDDPEQRGYDRARETSQGDEE